jgi:cell division protein FtsN
LEYYSFYDELPQRQVEIGDETQAPQRLRILETTKPKLAVPAPLPKPDLNSVMLPPPPGSSSTPTPEVIPAPADDRAGYIIQAGAFNHFAQADKVRERLAMLGISAYVQAGKIGNMPVHRVRIGPIRDASRAQAIRRRLDSNNIPAITIAPE